MINQAGTFGPWNFGGGAGERWEVRVLSQAAFHIREQVGDGNPLVRTLGEGVHKEMAKMDLSLAGPEEGLLRHGTHLVQEKVV